MRPVTTMQRTLQQIARRFMAGLAVSALTLGLCLPAAAQDEPPRIDWYVFDLPPVHILSGPDAGKGTGDSVLQFFMQSIMGFDQQTRDASVGRMMADAANHDGVCAVSLLYTPERQKTLLFARHRWRIEANRVLFRRQDAARFAPYLDAEQKIDLSALARDRALAGGFVDKRVYSAAIDTMIAGRQPGETLYTVDNNESAVRMMALGRLAYMFGYPFEVRYLAGRQKLSLDLQSAPARGDVLYRDVRPACSRGRAGSAMIAAIDALLDSQPLPQAVVEAHAHWMDPTGYVFEDAPAFVN